MGIAKMIPHALSPNRGPRLVKGVIVEPKYIFLHATVGNWAGSLSHLCNPGGLNPVSINYLIGESGEYARLVPDEERAWHAGLGFWEGITDMNTWSVGIEFVNRNDGRDPFDAPQLAAGAEIAAAVCTRYHILPIRSNFVQHLEYARPLGRKSDPAAFPIDKFIAMTAGLMGHATPPAPPAPAADPVKYTAFYVTPSNGVRVRSAPNLKGKIVATLPRSATPVYIDKVLTKAEKPDCEEVITGDSSWAHMAKVPGVQGDAGFIYARYLSEKLV
jgi:N-acetylmuramoyl-L-alanine amidase